MTTAATVDADRISASELIGRLALAGVKLSAVGQSLVAEPRAALTDEMRALIRAHKAPILEALAMSGRCIATVAISVAPAHPLQIEAEAKLRTDPNLRRAMSAEADTSATYRIAIAVRLDDGYITSAMLRGARIDGFDLIAIFDRHSSIDAFATRRFDE